jgi:predicted amidohydrolase
MIEMTLRVPDSLAPQLRRMTRWLPNVLELSLARFKTPTSQTVAELIEFLSAGPTTEQVAEYVVSARAQQRVRRLLTLNQAGLLSAEEHAELDEIETLDHLVTLLKAQAREQRAGGNE